MLTQLYHDLLRVQLVNPYDNLLRTLDTWHIFGTQIIHKFTAVLFSQILVMLCFQFVYAVSCGILRCLSLVFLANRWHDVDRLIESIIVCLLYCTIAEYFELWRCGRWRFLYVRLPYFVCICLSWCVYLTFSIEYNGPNYSDKPEFCQVPRGCRSEKL